MKNDIAIIGASYLQLPLIECAREMGYTTHVFAWECGDVGEEAADYFYPISIVEKEKILEVCRKINICGICSIASDLAVITVNYVAYEMGLTCNSPECVEKSTNKYAMRQAFRENSLLSPNFMPADSATDLDGLNITYPVIVKPTDRSGSRGIYRVTERGGLEKAVNAALDVSFEKRALIEEYIEGEEYSVEYLSYKGKHSFIALTYKYTTGAPRFIERGHLEPASISETKLNEIRSVVEAALDALGVTDGASHNEVRIDDEGRIWLIEIGARMGGDLIGSHLVKESTGIDMVRAVLQICTGKEPDIKFCDCGRTAGIRFILCEDDFQVLKRIQREAPEILMQWECNGNDMTEVTDSSERSGYYLLSGTDREKIIGYMP